MSAQHGLGLSSVDDTGPVKYHWKQSLRLRDIRFPFDCALIGRHPHNPEVGLHRNNRQPDDRRCPHTLALIEDHLDDNVRCGVNATEPGRRWAEISWFKRDVEAKAACQDKCTNENA